MPSRMQAVQTWICLRAPFTKARTLRRLGFQRRRRVLFAWLITFPNEGPLPHNSHFAIVATLLCLRNCLSNQTTKCNRVSKNSVAAGTLSYFLERLERTLGGIPPGVFQECANGLFCWRCRLPILGVPLLFRLLELRGFGVELSVEFLSSYAGSQCESMLRRLAPSVYFSFLGGLRYGRSFLRGHYSTVDFGDRLRRR